MTIAEGVGVALAAAALMTALAQLWIAVQTHGKVDTQVHQTNGLTANIAELNRTLGRAEGRAAAERDVGPMGPTST
jgi:hypothetical protein